MGPLFDKFRQRSRTTGQLPRALMVLGLAGIVVAVILNSSDARYAANQDWSPFVQVSGLLLIGMVAFIVDVPGTLSDPATVLPRMPCCLPI